MTMTSISDRTGVRQALCCECGNLRTVKARAGRRNHVGPGESPERIAELMDFAPDYWSRISAYHRLLQDLKCTPCGKVTQHAMVAPASGPGGAYRDSAEEENLGAVACAAPPGSVAADPFALVKVLGVRVIEVEALPDPILYLREQGMALVDADLDDDRRETAAGWLLASIAGA